MSLPPPGDISSPPLTTLGLMAYPLGDPHLMSRFCPASLFVWLAIKFAYVLPHLVGELLATIPKRAFLYSQPPFSRQ